MSKLKLSGEMIQIPLNQQKTVSVKTIQRNGFESKVQFISLQGVILKSFICDTKEVENMTSIYARNYNYKIVV